jgi:hypothetical protein
LMVSSQGFFPWLFVKTPEIKNENEWRRDCQCGHIYDSRICGSFRR